MSIKSYLKLVEINTKLASVIPFTLGTIYTLYRFNTFNIVNFILMFFSLLIFDMATTAINNFYDYKRAIKTEGYNYESHNAMVLYNLKESTVIYLIIAHITIASILGFLLFLNTSIVVLLLGVVSFSIGILYSFGPLPISRTFLGEVFSGFTMGLIIPLLAVYIHVYDMELLSWSFASGIFDLKINIKEILFIFLISVPTISTIANIMLANNICDIEDDLENKRYTLPIYIGKESALKLFKLVYYIVYIDFIILLFMKVIPLISILSLLTIIPVKKNIDKFLEKQTKQETFIISVKNLLIINVPFIITILIGVLF